MTVNRHLHHLFPFMEVKTTVPEEVVTGLQPDDAVGITAPGSSRTNVQDKIFSGWKENQIISNRRNISPNRLIFSVYLFSKIILYLYLIISVLLLFITLTDLPTTLSQSIFKSHHVYLHMFQISICLFISKEKILIIKLIDQLSDLNS